MPQTLFEFSGRSFGSQELKNMEAIIRHEFYDSDLNLEKENDELYIANRRASAGHFPIGQHEIHGHGRTIVRRSWKQIRDSSTDVYLIWLPIHGSVFIDQNGRHEIIDEGNIAISYSNTPFRIECRTNAQNVHSSLQAVVPAHLLSRALPHPKRICGTPFKAAAGAPNMARKILLSLFEEADYLSRDLAVSFFSAAVDAVAEAVRTSENGVVEPLGLREERLKRLLDYLELHSSDPDLTAFKVAKGCGISARYVHYLLKSGNRSFHDSVWERRLERAYTQLTDKSLSRRSIAEIAYGVGFKSSAHFSRSFRKRFGASPREIRQKALDS